MFGKSRRVENDEAVLLLHLFHEAEGILGISLMARVAGEVKLHVGFDQLNGLSTAVNGMDQPGSAPYSRTC